MVNATLHYIYDPFCGWCYAASPLMRAAAGLEGLRLELHAGGMMSGPARQMVSPALRDYVMPHDHRIAAMTGLSFGEAYFEGLLRDNTAVFDSTPPIEAVLAFGKLGGQPQTMLARLQQAHYQQGRRIADEAVLLELAQELGQSAEAFSQALQSVKAEAEAHIAATRQLMSQTGVRGFPALLMERDGQWQRIDLSSWLGQPEAFAAALRDSLPQADAADGAFCTPEGCQPGG
ncbi:DsbA family protein [uncultured Aquitalea sp.]|uniref:DsbA family protein n=2 Tax=uncultured Aquitalea sp. TaxID=540272 RepID=UPI0025EA6C7A|nr:DsbA family protein [uncultured Aquitalea sp.]